MFLPKRSHENLTLNSDLTTADIAELMLQNQPQTGKITYYIYLALTADVTIKMLTENTHARNKKADFDVGFVSGFPAGEKL